jgi:hypothetical protein
MRTVEAITETEFLRLAPQFAVTLPTTTEKGWYRCGDVLGLVLIDNVDHDWSWVVLGRDEGGNYRAVDLGVNCATDGDAYTAMSCALR